MNVSDALRRSIERSGLSRYEIAKQTGVSQSQLSRFVAFDRGLSLDSVDRLAAFFKLELTPRKRTTRKGR